MEKNFAEMLFTWPVLQEKEVQGQPKSEIRSDLSPRTSSKKPFRYSLRDDLEILRYVRSRPIDGHLSRCYWKRAVHEDGLLGKLRAAESLRDRYRRYLKVYTDEAFNDLENRVKANEPSYDASISKSLPQKGEYKPFKIIRKEKEVDNTYNNDIFFNQNSKPVSNVVDKFNDSPLHRYLWQKEDIYCLTATDEFIGEEDKESYESLNQKQAPSTSFSELNNSEAQEDCCDKFFATENYEDGHQAFLNRSIKRKDYQNMHSIDHLLCPKKVLIKSPVTAAASKAQEAEFLKTFKWSAFTDRERLRELFYYCSMDTHNVDKYFNGETHLLWTEEEDQLITGPTRHIGEIILSRYKGSINVEQRIKFLEKMDEMNKLQAQKANFTQFTNEI